MRGHTDERVIDDRNCNRNDSQGRRTEIRKKSRGWDSDLGSADELGSGGISNRGADNWDCITVNSRIDSGSVVGEERKIGTGQRGERGGFGGRCNDLGSVKLGAHSGSVNVRPTGSVSKM